MSKLYEPPQKKKKKNIESSCKSQLIDDTIWAADSFDAQFSSVR